MNRVAPKHNMRCIVRHIATIITNNLFLLFQAVSIADEDLKRQEERVAIARKKLQDALRAFQT